jgi:transcriptional regulator with XRE-family HTH domain
MAMSSSAELVTMIHRRSGLSLAELARRSGFGRATLTRWRSGEQLPSLEALEHLAASVDLEVTSSVFTADDSLDSLVDDQLKLTPTERVRSLVFPAADGALNALGWVARLAAEHVIVGEVADVLLGGPQTTRGVVDVVLPHAQHIAFDDTLLDVGAWPADQEHHGPLSWTLPGGGMLRLVERPAGTQGYEDLVREAEPVSVDAGGEFGEVHLMVAAPIDLRRIAEGSEPGRVRRSGVKAIVRRREAAADAAVAA